MTSVSLGCERSRCRSFSMFWVCEGRWKFRLFTFRIMDISVVVGAFCSLFIRKEERFWCLFGILGREESRVSRG